MKRVSKDLMPLPNRKLYEIIEQNFDGSVRQFCQECKVSQPRINRLFFVDVRTGKFPSVSHSLQRVVINHFSLPDDYFANDNVGKRLTTTQSTIDTRPRINVKAAAGSLDGFADSVMLRDCEQIPVIKVFPTYDFTIIISGESMEPLFYGGDEVAIRRVLDFIEWGKTYVLDTRDGAVIKRLYDDGESFRCVSYNSDYKDFCVSKSDVFAVYKIVGLLRHF